MTQTVDVRALQDAVRDLARTKMVDVGDRFVEIARGFAPRRTGAGAESIVATEPVESGSAVSVRVEVGEFYMTYQDQGTGIFGPDGAPIVPRRPGGVLVFDWPAAGGIVFARQVRGTEPTRFWQKTVELWPQIIRSA